MTKTSDAIIEGGGLLGALLLLSVLVNLVLGWVVIRVQNARVKDTERIGATAEKMVETFAGVQNTLSNLSGTSQTQAQAVQHLTTTMQTLLLASTRSGPLPGSGGGGGGGAPPLQGGR